MKYFYFYQRYFRNLRINEVGEAAVRCPFHDDKHPSMSINVETGLFKCFTPTCSKAGDAYTFYQLYHHVGFKEAKEEVDKILGERREQQEKKISEKIVEKFHENLMKNKEKLIWLKERRGFTDKTIEKFRIGWDFERYTIPILDEAGNVVNIRRYSPEAKGKNKMVSYKTGFGKARLFPVENLKGDTVLICEGEMDCILANQIGYNAISVTGGAGTWKSEWNELFRGKKVYICYDVDEAGKEGAKKVARNLFGVADEVYIVNLPLKDPKDADITDYFVASGHSKKDFDKLLAETRIYVPSANNCTIDDSAIYDVHLSEASHSKYYHKLVRFNVTVVGKDLAPFMVPRTVRISCDFSSKRCSICPLSFSNGEKVIRLDYRVLEMIDLPEKVQEAVFRKEAGIPRECNRFMVEKTEFMNVEEVLVTPQISSSAGEFKYVLRKVFFLGHGIDTSRNYIMEGLTMPEPRTQHATHLIRKAERTQDDIASFKMTDELKDELSIFQSSSVETKFEEIAIDLEHNVTRIYGRHDLLIAIDLVYHSLLSFYFQNRLVEKGWLELLVLGDTRTGKTETAKNIMNHYGLGEFVTGENVSLPGLIGGMQQSQGKRWMITWGKIPLNDMRLVIIDEASGLTHEMIAAMSGMRSSGIAEIAKIQTERTLARTRLVWMSNPRSARTLASYSFGVEAIPELIGKPEDIARFDLCVTAASEEVSSKVINTYRREKFTHKYTSSLCKNLILWVWSRKPEQVFFTERATKAILDYAVVLGETYSSQIPLIEAADARIKLAKLAAACAARLFSTEDGENVVIRKKHVDFVFNFLNKIYKKPSLSYYQFSRQKKLARDIVKKNLEEIKTFIHANEEVVRLFQTYSHLKETEIEAMLNIERSEVKDMIRKLVRWHLIVKTPYGYRKDPIFIKIIRKELKDV